MQIRVLSATDLKACIDMPTAIEAMRGAFSSLARGDATVPVRLVLSTSDGVSLFMPAHLTDIGAMATKVVSVNTGNAEKGLPVINAVVLAIDPETGVPTALMDGTWLTALRTGAVGGLAADVLARSDARRVALFGAGVQARTQLEAVRCVREVDHVSVFSPSGASAGRLVDELTGVEAVVAASPAEAIREADIIIAATDSSTPVFAGADVRPGTHVTGVGSFTPEMREVDADLVQAARVVVDQTEAALEEAGDLIGPINDGLFDESIIDAELGDILLGRAEGRTSPDQVTYFKSVGNAIQDVAVAARVLEAAEAEGRGVVVDLS